MSHAPLHGFVRTVASVKPSLTRRLLVGSLVLLTAVLLLDPGDKLFHVKVPCFLMVMLIWLVRVGYRKPIAEPRVVAMIVVVSILIPAAWAFLAVATNRASETEFLFTYPKAFLFLTLLLVVYNERIRLDRIAAWLSIPIGIATISVVIVSKVSPVLGTGIYLFAAAKDMAVINESRDQFGIGVGQFFYNTSPIMLLGLAYFLHRVLFAKKRRKLYLSLSLLLQVALIFSGARGNLIASILVVGVLLSVRMTRSIGVLPAMIVACLLFVIPFIFLANALLNPTETSNEIKLAHYQSYVDLFGEHPSYLVFGQGEGTQFYSVGFGDYAYVTELTYLELIRQFGILMTSVFLGLLFAPLVLLLRQKPRASDVLSLATGYMAYLMVSATNPLLVSSTGMLVVVTVWARGLEKSVEAPPPGLSPEGSPA